MTTTSRTSTSTTIPLAAKSWRRPLKTFVSTNSKPLKRGAPTKSRQFRIGLPPRSYRIPDWVALPRRGPTFHPDVHHVRFTTGRPEMDDRHRYGGCHHCGGPPRSGRNECHSAVCDLSATSVDTTGRCCRGGLHVPWKRTTTARRRLLLSILLVSSVRYSYETKPVGTLLATVRTPRVSRRLGAQTHYDIRNMNAAYRKHCVPIIPMTFHGGSQIAAESKREQNIF
jgi:hypothetical protein